MRDYLTIGATPCEESCEPVPYKDGGIKAKAECAAFIEAIRRKLGPEPAGAQLRVKSFPHDFGTYYEVVCWYEEDDVEACQYAYRCESDAPTTWADAGLDLPPLFKENDPLHLLAGNSGL